MYQGLSFEGYKSKVNELRITVTNEELAHALHFSDANKFYSMLRVDDLNGLNDTYDKAQEIVAEHSAASNIDRWKTEKCYIAMTNPDEFMNLLCVVANEKRFPDKVVGDCKQVLMVAVKKGADIYSNMAAVIAAQQKQEEIYNSLPSTLETWEDLEKYRQQSQPLFDQMHNMQKLSPYKQVFDAVSDVVDVEIKLQSAAEEGDRQQVTILTKQLEGKVEHMNAVTSLFDPEMLSRVAKGKSDLAKLTVADPEKGETLKDQKEKAILATLYTKAKELERDRLERQGLDDEIELQGLEKKNDDDDD